MSSRRRNALKFLLAVAIAGMLVSCETVTYYTQAARGQLSILLNREDIQNLLDTEDLTPELRAKLQTVLAIREFAENELHLPLGNNYLTYVDLDRDHVVWNVFAAPEFSVSPVNWCYPIAGCVSYRGYFSEQGAARFAAQLQAQNYDVYTGGVDAYSTLGWFDDSLLSTVSDRADYQLASLIFHELAHQVVYLPGETTFNESFATAVEREGLRRWLLAQNHDETLLRAETERTRQSQFVALVADYRDRLDALYQEALSPETMRARKAQLQEAMRAEYRQLQQDWGGYAGYDSWFADSLNNAQLSTVSSYNDLVPFFSAEFDRAGQDFVRFYEQVSALASLGAQERDALIVEFELNRAN